MGTRLSSSGVLPARLAPFPPPASDPAEVGAKFALPYHLCQISVCCGHQSNVHFLLADLVAPNQITDSFSPVRPSSRYCMSGDIRRETGLPVWAGGLRLWGSARRCDNSHDCGGGRLNEISAFHKLPLSRGKLLGRNCRPVRILLPEKWPMRESHVPIIP